MTKDLKTYRSRAMKTHEEAAQSLTDYARKDVAEGTITAEHAAKNLEAQRRHAKTPAARQIFDEAIQELRGEGS